MQKLYPAVYKHLLPFKEKAKKRDDQGKNWWNLRACAYYTEFEKEKIVFTKGSKKQAFAFDDNCFFILNTCYIATGENLKYLLAILNSNLIKLAFLNFYQSGGIDGEITLQAIKQLPVPIL